MQRLKVYDADNSVYHIARSTILGKVFMTQEKYTEEEIWPKLLSHKCKASRSSKKVTFYDENTGSK